MLFRLRRHHQKYNFIFHLTSKASLDKLWMSNVIEYSLNFEYFDVLVMCNLCAFYQNNIWNTVLETKIKILIFAAGRTAPLQAAASRRLRLLRECQVRRHPPPCPALRPSLHPGTPGGPEGRHPAMLQVSGKESRNTKNLRIRKLRL